MGPLALENNTSGASNTAIGDDAPRFNVDGSNNVAVGDEARTGADRAARHLVHLLARAGELPRLDEAPVHAAVKG